MNTMATDGSAEEPEGARTEPKRRFLRPKSPRHPRAPAQPKSLNFLERFIDRYFMIMPGWVRVVVYLLIVVTFIDVSLKPTPLQGDLTVITSEGVRIRGQKYGLESGLYAVSADANGKWVLLTRRRLPGSIRVTVNNALGVVLGDVKLPMPLPIFSELSDQRYDIEYSERTHKLQVASAPRYELMASAYADQTEQTFPPDREDGIVIGLKKFTVKENGSDGIGRVYAKVYLDGHRIETPKLPQERFHNTFLAIKDDSVNLFDNLFFTIPAPLTGTHSVKIEFYEYDHGFFLFGGKDDLIGVFRLKVGAGASSNGLPLESGTIGGRKGNSSLLLTINRESQGLPVR